MALLSVIAGELNARATGVSQSAEVVPVRSSVTNDSRAVVEGGIFVAIKGLKSDGNLFVDQALAKGAAAIVSEMPAPPSYQGAWLQVSDARVALAQAAAAVYGHPSKYLKLVGITGTNGKTTTAHHCESLFRAAGSISAMMGTIGYRIGETDEAAEHTTPEAGETQAFLRRAVDAGAKYAVMEVSSIALDLHRADCLEFEVAAFTNLTQDHLDYHGTMERYAAAKAQLFAMPVRSAVVNIDDEFGASLAENSKSRVLSYGIREYADIYCKQNDFGADGLSFEARTPLGPIDVRSALVGRPHAYNILCAIGIGIALGFDAETIARGINTSRGAAGRLERVPAGENQPVVVVDYAHTPDALINVLATARDMAKARGGRLISIFGCGGDRDRTKRPIMGEAAGRMSDVVIATSDNPRTEDPMKILEEIEQGLKQSGKTYSLILDRKEAIFAGIDQAANTDVVLIAGKGHEDYQIIGTVKSHFDDREVAIAALAVKSGAMKPGT